MVGLSVPFCESGPTLATAVSSGFLSFGFLFCLFHLSHARNRDGYSGCGHRYSCCGGDPKIIRNSDPVDRVSGGLALMFCTMRPFGALQIDK